MGSQPFSAKSVELVEAQPPVPHVSPLYAGKKNADATSRRAHATADAPSPNATRPWLLAMDES
jgi:hypothetical protein